MNAQTSSIEDDSDTIIAGVKPWETAVIDQIVMLKRKNQLPHAILLEMRTSADGLAFGWYLITALVCEDQGVTTPCGSCRACQQMSANTYPDLSFVTLVENEKTRKINRDIKIEQIRKLIHRLSLTTTYRAGKSALIYPAERMNSASANSLLKTLEEASSDATLVLLTHNAGRLPITIRSRCQRWTVPFPDPELASQWLIDQGISKDEAAAYLKLAQQDAQLALELFRRQAFSHLRRFEAALQEYINGRTAVLNVVDSIKQLDEDDIILLVQQVILDQIQSSTANVLSAQQKGKLGALLDLRAQAVRVLQSSENNLILRLQLEDVLISFKQILNQENQHASTSQPGNTVA